MQYRPPRLPCDKPVRLTSTGVTAPATVVDCAHTGAGLALTAPLKRGERINLATGDQVFAARIMWVRGKRAGVKFDAALSEMQVRLLRQTGARAGTPLRAPRRAGHGFRELSR